MSTETLKRETLNVASRLDAMAAKMPEAIAVAEPTGRNHSGTRRYSQLTFRQLKEDVDCLARGLNALGVVQGTRIALLVRPGIDFISLVFALLKSGAVTILMDPGMGRKHLLRSLRDVEPEGFVAISKVHAIRVMLGRRFRKARINVTVGRRWFWGGATLRGLRRSDHRDIELPDTAADDPAAIIFTTGSTGPPKGVLYSHGNFDHQVTQIRDEYKIQPGEIDLPGFPLFGLFNAAMGVTTIVPDMDPTRPAEVNSQKIVEAINQWGVTQAFGSPAMWNRVSWYCTEHGVELPTLRRVLSAGAPVPPDVLERMKACMAPGGQMHTPYGATEALPVSSISSEEVLGDTAARSAQGAGTCVGRKFPGIQWKVIREVDGPIATIENVHELPCGEIGELIVHGPVVTRKYVTWKQYNARSKIVDGDDVWHRMGDIGYLDESGRFWFCGRLSHRVLTSTGPMEPVRCEAIFNLHPHVYRTALVGVGPKGQQRPVLVVEPLPENRPETTAQREELFRELRELGRANQLTESICDFLLHPSLPVDIRHNWKIFREKLSPWAAKQLETMPSGGKNLPGQK